MTKVLLVAEGEHEHGDKGDHSALAILVRRLLNDSSAVDFEHRKPNDKVFRRYRPPGRGARYAKVIAGFLRGAEIDGFDAVAFLIDEDGDAERRQAISEGQATTTFALPRACGLAIRTFDAWMLADEKALGTALETVVDRQPEPEDMARPKQVCRTLHEDSPRDEKLRDVYAAVAQAIDLHTLAQRCPRGFAPFADRIRIMGDEIGNQSS